jgi:hypothetical protein
MNEEPDRDAQDRVFTRKYPSSNYYYFARRYYFSCEACSICFEPLHVLQYPVTFTAPDKNDNVQMLNCAETWVRATRQCCHKFHSKCIDAWLDSGSDTCPICKREVTGRKIIQRSKYDLTDDDFWRQPLTYGSQVRAVSSSCEFGMLSSSSCCSCAVCRATCNYELYNFVINSNVNTSPLSKYRTNTLVVACRTGGMPCGSNICETYPRLIGQAH